MASLSAAQNRIWKQQRRARGDVCVHVWMPADMVARIEDRRSYEGVSRPELVRMAVARLLSERTDLAQ